MDPHVNRHSAIHSGPLPPPNPPLQQDVTHYRNGPPNTYVPLQPSTAIAYPGPSGQHAYPQPSEAQQSPDDQSPTANPNDPNDLKRPRACEACRQLKVKCELDEADPTGTCKRCAKANRQCIVTAPSRKRQKKTDSRVAELEKKIDALTASLAARGGPDSEAPLDPAIVQQQSMPPQPSPRIVGRWQHDIAMSPRSVINVKRKASEDYENNASTYIVSRPPPPASHSSVLHTSQAEPPRPQNDSHETSPFDAIDSGLIDAVTARRCFERYVHEMAGNLPLVVFPPNTHWDDVRRSRPVLFLSLVTVASGAIKPEIQTRLSTEISRILADRIVFRGEKSLELVQTLLITALFYQPPERYEELNFNQIIHMAAVMCLDLGWGKRAKKNGLNTFRSMMGDKKAAPDPNSAEVRRTWLGCYFMGCNASMSLRRPLFVRWGPYADECLETLSTAPDALRSDKWLCHVIRIQHLAEDIGFEFSMDDPASALTLTDSKTQHHMKAFERRLNEWHDTAMQELANDPLVVHFSGIIGLYMHEIALHDNHNIDDFKPPFVSTPIAAGPEPEHVTSAHVDAFSAILSNIHVAFDAFLSLDIRSLRALPILFYVRNSYAAVALIKLYSAISAEGSKYGKIFKLEELKVDYYLENLLNLLIKIAENGLSKIAGKFVIIFTMLKTWHTKRTEPGNSNITLGQSIAKVKAAQGGPLQPGLPGPLPPPPPTPVTPMRAFTANHASGSETQPRSGHSRGNSNIDPGLAQGQILPPLSQARNGLHMLSDAAMAPPHQHPSPSRSHSIPRASASSPSQYQSTGLSPSRYQQHPSPQMHHQPHQSWLPPPPSSLHHQQPDHQQHNHNVTQSGPPQILLPSAAPNSIPTSNLHTVLHQPSPPANPHSHSHSHSHHSLTNGILSDPSNPPSTNNNNNNMYNPTPASNTTRNVGGPYPIAPVAPQMIQEYLNMNDFSSDELWALGFGDEFVGMNLNFGFDQAQWDIARAF